jgi:3-hydroxyisobutyrate dehydrogenase-like beta-hydroxyacid dehydrogenase
MKRVGFVGLGLMGGAMAKNLLAAGYEVVGRAAFSGRCCPTACFRSESRA